MNGSDMQCDLEIKKDEKIETTIEKLVYGGDGFTHIGSRACFVANAVPGDEIIAEIRNIKKQYLNASINKIIKHSTKRIAPPCPYHMNCGGCQWQHIDYNYQLHWKQEILNESLERIGNLSDIKINKIIPSSKKFNYRIRTIMQLDGKKMFPGYFMRNSHKIIPIKSCMLLEEPINKALHDLSNTIQKISASQKIKNIEFLYLKKAQKVILSFNSSSYKKRVKPLIYACDKRGIIEKADLIEEINGLNFIRSQRRFYQINYQQNINMIKVIIQFFAELDNPDILDLYCGCGNFSLFLAKNGAKISGIDFDSKVIQEAVQNIKANSIDNCSFKAYDLSKHNANIYKSRHNGVLLNPPRTGATKNVLEHILSINPEVIVYVSCNPATLSRDLKILLDKNYRISEIQPLDMFPQTYHIETIVKLTKI
jgi:23S rRNA (uracil1939-C5)-methyltransferase